jgi:SAM-dependent methyltransferase
MRLKDLPRDVIAQVQSLGDKSARKRLKQEARQRAFESSRWDRGEELARRRYDSYDAYVAHQAAKLDTISRRLNEKEDEDFQNFVGRFRSCEPLQGVRDVLCLGARLGTEVKALISLGYFAVGLDLNPGKDNAYVLPGDFHHTIFADGTVGAVYCNALDHAFDLEAMLAEIKRVLRPDGLFIADLVAGLDEGMTPGAYEAIFWNNTRDFANQIAEIGGLSLESFRDLGQTRRDRWYQAVFRKDSATPA